MELAKGVRARYMNRLNSLFLTAQELHHPNSSRVPGGARVVAALYIKNEMVGLGWNQNRTSPFQAQHGKNSDAIYLHAELHAIKQALRVVGHDDLIRAKTTLFVCRAKRTRRAGPFVWGLARPCSGCMGAISKDWFKIKNVVYSLNEDEYGRDFEVLSQK